MKSLKPKIQFAYFHFLVFVFLFFSLLAENSIAQDFKTAHPGVEYAHVDHKIGSDPVKINLLRLDLKKVRLDVYHAFDNAIGVAPTSEIAQSHNAIAAINAGFFRLDKSQFVGDAAGLLIIDREIFSEATRDRIAIGISNRRKNTEVEFGHSDLHCGAKIGRFTFDFSGINRERGANEVILYTPQFNTTTLTSSDGIEIVIKQDRVVQIASGSSLIPRGGYVISAGGRRGEEMKKVLRVGQAVELVTLYTTKSISHQPDPPKVEDDEDVVAGVPQLIKNGEIDITWEQEKASKSFAEMRHPRTAVAKLKDGKFLMITVDGRQPGVSVGMNLQELAEYLLSLGATDAMNLDGGGSTTMFLDGKVVNTPSEKDGERKVSDAIIVTLRKNTRR